jgi:hypothetical protein
MVSVRSIALLFAASGLVLGGCGTEPTGTPGQLRTLRFAYAIPACHGCSAETSIDREVLAGSALDIDVSNVNYRVSYAVRSTAPDVAEFRFTPRCRKVLDVDCHETVAVQAKQAGDADLEMYDEWTGTVLDRVTVKVRDAATIDTTVRVTPERGGPATEVEPAPSGEIELRVDSNIEIISIPRSTSGSELIASSEALERVYADETVIGPRPVSATVPGVEYAKAKTPGFTTVAVEVPGSGVRHELAFRVVK